MKKNFKFDQPSNSPGFLLWQVSNYWQREIKKALHSFGLTHTQFVVLAGIYWLSSENETVTQVKLARHLNIDVMMTSNVLRLLQKKGFLERIEHKTDTRAKIIKLTPSGLNIIKESVNNVEKFDSEFFSNISNLNKFNEELNRLLSQSGN